MVEHWVALLPIFEFCTQEDTGRTSRVGDGPRGGGIQRWIPN